MRGLKCEMVEFVVLIHNVVPLTGKFANFHVPSQWSLNDISCGVGTVMSACAATHKELI